MNLFRFLRVNDFGHPVKLEEDAKICIEDMVVDQSRYTVPWALYPVRAREEVKWYINPKVPTSRTWGGTAMVQVVKTHDNHYKAYLPKEDDFGRPFNHEWSYGEVERISILLIPITVYSLSPYGDLMELNSAIVKGDYQGWIRSNDRYPNHDHQYILRLYHKSPTTGGKEMFYRQFGPFPSTEAARDFCAHYKAQYVTKGFISRVEIQPLCSLPHLDKPPQMP